MAEMVDENRDLKKTIDEMTDERRNFKKTIDEMTDEKRDFKKTIAKMADEIRDLKKIIDDLKDVTKKDDKIRDLTSRIAFAESRLAYYENSNTPPSANSLEWQREKREKKEARKNGTSAPRRKAGGRPGHKGTSMPRNPSRTEEHKLDETLKCCGHPMIIRTKKRYIKHLIPARCEQVLHCIDVARCSSCGKAVEAEHDLPKKGSYCKKLVGHVARLRAARMPVEEISKYLNETVENMSISKATIVNIMARTAEALFPQHELILDEIKASKRANLDETSNNIDGEDGWTWVIRHKNMVWIKYTYTRSAMVVDSYMDDFKGVVTSDMYSVYNIFDKDGMHQVCWAHELRHAKHETRMMGKAGDRGPPLLYEELCKMFDEARNVRKANPSSAKIRGAFEHSLRCLLQRHYRVDQSKRMEKLLNRLNKALPRLFAFLEFDDVSPTNNAAEQALRYVVIFRKISGQIKGGETAMKQMSAFVSCVLTWRYSGKNLLEEIARVI